MHLPPNSQERFFVRAAIHAAYAGLKEKMCRPSAVLRLCTLAEECLGATNLPDRVLGCTVSDLRHWLSEAAKGARDMQ